MSEFRGYTKRSLELIKQKQLKVGDSVKIEADLTYEGIIMPRYEHADDAHIVIKLKSGYNIGISLEKIKDVQKVKNAKHAVPEKIKIKKNAGLPKVLLLSTGGTIASKIDYRTGAVTPTLTAQELNMSIPELSAIADIDARVLLAEYSENIVPQDWLQIAQEIQKYSDSDQYVGIVIAHGTDTMHYTSSFLSFALAGFALPIALVGSQRSSDRASSDAASNLIGAVQFVTKCKTSGVYVVMHQNENDRAIACHVGTRVRKNHTSKRGAFETIGGDPAFLIVDDKICKNTESKFFSTNQFRPVIKLSEKVALVKYYPGYNPDTLKKIIDSGIKAIVFEGTGLGHVGKNMYGVIKQAQEKGIFMGMTSQCIEGRVQMTVYESGRDLLNLGITPLNIIPETALVKAMWAAGYAQDYLHIKEIMLKQIASEFST